MKTGRAKTDDHLRLTSFEEHKLRASKRQETPKQRRERRKLARIAKAEAQVAFAASFGIADEFLVYQRNFAACLKLRGKAARAKRDWPVDVALSEFTCNFIWGETLLKEISALAVSVKRTAVIKRCKVGFDRVVDAFRRAQRSLNRVNAAMNPEKGTR